MSVLHAAEASRLLLDTAEAGGSAAVGLVVGGSGSGAGAGPGAGAGSGAGAVSGAFAEAGTRLAVTRGPGPSPEVVRGSTGRDDLDDALSGLLRRMLDDPRAGDALHTLVVDGGEVEVYVELRRPVQELVVVGAGHIARPLTRMGASLGFRVTVLDDRPDFATRERFPEAERLVKADFDDPFRDVPVHERTHILLVTRGHKYDYACLVRALRMDPPPAYIGMIGSRRRVRATYVQLMDDGIDPVLLGRIHAPVGLDIGAETPEEIAVAVAAELVLVRRGGSGRPLRDVERIAERFFADDRDHDAPPGKTRPETRTEPE
ncbi:MAG: XdhC family protein [Gemmatimonadota bacterium]